MSARQKSALIYDVEYCNYPTPLGMMTIAASQHQIYGIWFEGQSHHPDTSSWRFVTSNTQLQSVQDQLQAYFSKELQTFDLPINFSLGTPFQQAVWHSLAQTPFGKRSTYSHIAQTIGKPKAVRAVANAIARNRWMIALPCHRIIGTNGSLTGYAGGIQRKSALLALESPF